MKRFTTFLSFLAFGLSATGAFAQDKAIMGFKDPATELELEKKFDQQLKAENLDQWLKRMSSRPHHVGSPFDKDNADFMAAMFKSWGYDAEVVSYDVLFPTPKVRLLEMTGPTRFKAGLVEPALKEDATSGQTKEQLPVYNAYSADGDVTAELVYVNYGVPADYEELEKAGIDVKGKIVIAKYYGSWRGIKPKLAAEKGAIGCIIYSDPADDGYVQGDVYPEGPYRSEQGAQRGSVMDMPLYPGDPLTPGIGATKDAKRLDIKTAPTLTKIPVIPISYGDAKPLLDALGGPVAPPSWRGGLPITYHIGPGPAKVHLKLEFNWDIKPAYNVIAKMKGSEFPDQWVIRGNHHDAWVNGAADPVSGMVALMEEARAVAELTKTGWKPKRTLVYCGWDAEEPGLIGSTESAEDHAAELKEKAVAYINTDGNGRGFLFAGGSHTLEELVGEVAASVTDPQKGVTLAERRKAFDIVNSGNPDHNGFQISALGSGSDFTPFIQHLGIASLNVGFGGESGGGEYHSIYDSYDHYSRFQDPGMVYGVVLAQVCGRLTMRLANADILPFEFDHFYSTVATYADEVMKLPEQMRKEAEKINGMLKQNYYDLAADPKQPNYKPLPPREVPYLNFSPLQTSLATLKEKAAVVEGLLKAGSIEPAKWAKVNELLYQSERTLIDESGLPRRDWFKHEIYAPGFYTGYGVKTLPGVREAIEQEEWAEAQEEIVTLAATLDKFNSHLDKIIDAAK
ncbi:MAG: transferrin receptor-like dimerization domain-containing protein [Imperialibacter sp.]|uniref:transferrin receptor-like dimerization domain-containing protein n=1 Tax=Imperialibacter sp. TaxID=2038411 RepID=UPI0032EFB7D8